MSRLPPYAELLGIEREGEVLVMRFGPHLIGAPGRLHGGAVAGLMELAANLAVREQLGDPAAGLKPVNVTVDYLREGGAAGNTRPGNLDAPGTPRCKCPGGGMAG